LSTPQEISPLDLGKALRFCRKTVGLTQRAVADESGIKASYISRLESGEVNPTVSTMEGLAKGLGVDSSKFLAVAEVYAIGRKRVTS
jgi:transcriptional regulator with XRE-family HTH domain